MKNIFYKLHSEQKGIALLFSILITSALLIVAFGIGEVSLKEQVFSLEAKDSSRAFTAADTGIECAMYMDSMQAFTGTSSDPFYCHGIDVAVTQTSDTQFQFALAITPTSCAQIYVDKGAGTAGTSTQIDSYGYNIGEQVTNDPQSCVGSTISTNGIVSRALRVTYSD